MKKTLTALMALASVAMADTNLSYSQYSDELKKGLLFAYSFDNGATADYTADGVTLSGSFTQNNGVGTCTGSSYVYSDALTLTGDFSLSFNFVDGEFSQNTALVSLFSDTTSTGRNNCIMLTNNNASNMNLSCLGFGGSAWVHPYDNKKFDHEGERRVPNLIIVRHE